MTIRFSHTLVIPCTHKITRPTYIDSIFNMTELKVQVCQYPHTVITKLTTVYDIEFVSSQLQLHEKNPEMYISDCSDKQQNYEKMKNI